MSLLTWIATYLLNLLFWIWLLNWGADRLEESWIGRFLIARAAEDWDSDQLRIYAFCMLFATTFWFVLGLIFPETRFFNPLSSTSSSDFP